MAIQNRRGQAVDFVPSKMLPGEFAVSLDNRKLYMCFASGTVKEVALTDDVTQAISAASTSLGGRIAVLESASTEQGATLLALVTRMGTDEAAIRSHDGRLVVLENDGTNIKARLSDVESGTATLNELLTDLNLNMITISNDVEGLKSNAVRFDTVQNKSAAQKLQARENTDSAGIASLATAYSSSARYAVGDMVTYDGKLYTCKTAITTAEAWNSSHWTEVTVGDQLSDLKDDLEEFESDVFAPGGYQHKTVAEFFSDGTVSNAVIYPPNAQNTSIGINTGELTWKSLYVQVAQDIDIFFDSSLNIGRFLIGKISNVTNIIHYGNGSLEFIGTDAIRHDYKDGGEAFPTELDKLHVDANDYLMISLNSSINPNNVTVYYGEEQLGTKFNADIKLNDSQVNQVLGEICYVATNYGISTESSDNTSALQSLIDMVSDNGGGVIFFPNGTYQFQRAAGRYTVLMRSNVSIIGENSTKTIFKQTGASSSMFYKLATADSPIVGCVFKNFTVDAYETEYEAGVQPWETSAKAFLFQYVEDCVFEDLILKGTLATALGIDYLNEVKINNVTVIDGGRVYDGTQEGTSGIGIGTGGWDEENFTITDCVCVGCGQYGIFIENQYVMGWGGSTDTSKGQIIANCIIRDGLNNGLGIRSGSNVIVTGCLIYGNAKHGINIDKNIDTVMISDCIIRDNLQNGITIVADIASENMNITNCVVSGNANNGIYISPTATFTDLQIKENTIIENAGNGIECASPVQFLALIGNYTKGNLIGLYISASSFAMLIVKYNVFYDYFCNKNTGSDSGFNDIYGDIGDATATARGETTNN